MKNIISFIIVVLLNITSITNVNALCFSVNCIEKGAGHVTGQAKEVVKSGNKVIDEETKRWDKDSKEALKNANKIIDEETRRWDKDSKEAINNANQWIDKKTKSIHKSYKATAKKLDRETTKSTNYYKSQINNNVNSAKKSLNQINNSTNHAINQIRQGAQYESQKASRKIEASTRRLDDFRRNNPINNRALSSAFQAAKQSVSTTSKSFGNSVTNSTKNAFSRLESSAPAKTLNKWGKRASTEKIVKGFNNTVDHIESSGTAKGLNRWGKRASMENIRKAVPNTIEYWESSDEGRALNNLGKRVSVGNISKGVKNTKDYWESSEGGKAINKAGKDVNEYVDVRATSIDKKATAAMDADSPSEWFGDKVLGRKARRHHNATLIRQYGEEHKCERNEMYGKLGYSLQQAAILNYFLYGDDCENIRDLKTVDAFIYFFGNEFSKRLKVKIESERRLDDKALEQLFLSTFDNTYREFYFTPSTSKTSFMLSNIENDAITRPSEQGETDTYSQYAYDDMAVISASSQKIDISEQDAGVIKPRSPKKNSHPPPEQPDYSDQNIDHTPAPTVRELWQKEELAKLKKNTKSFSAQFKRNFIKPLTNDARTIISMHKKTIDLTKNLSLKLASDEIKGIIEDTFVNVFSTSLEVSKGVFKGVLEVNKMINTTFETYRKKTLKNVQKDDPNAKPVPDRFDGGGGIATAHKFSQECGCTVWEGVGKFWYYHKNPKYVVVSRSTRVLYGNSQFYSGNNKLDKRPESFVTDVLRDSTYTYLGDFFKGKITSKLKGMFKTQLKG